MGLGGQLIWTGVLKAVYEHDGRAPLVCHTPRLTDLLLGSLYDRSLSLADDPIFRHQPHLRFPPVRGKTRLSAWIDRVFWQLLGRIGLRRSYERWVLRRTQGAFSRGQARYVHVDMLIHSYAVKQTAKRMIWKSGGHVSEIIARGLGVATTSPTCTLVFTAQEEAWLSAFLHRHGLHGAYIVIEPGTNTDWFGNLRAWPIARWQALVQQLLARYPDMPIVQIGLASTALLDGVVDLRGQTEFRQAALLIRAARLFIGTEGGLMHAAKAVDADAVIVWGGVTLPEFAGYPKRHRIVCHYVECAPCGNLGWCERGHICMQHIHVDEVCEAVNQELDRLGAG